MGEVVISSFSHLVWPHFPEATHYIHTRAHIWMAMTDGGGGEVIQNYSAARDGIKPVSHPFLATIWLLIVPAIRLPEFITLSMISVYVVPCPASQSRTRHINRELMYMASIDDGVDAFKWNIAPSRGVKNKHDCCKLDPSVRTIQSHGFLMESSCPPPNCMAVLGWEVHVILQLYTYIHFKEENDYTCNE